MVDVKKYRRMDLKPSKPQKETVYGLRCPCCGSDLEFTKNDLNQDVEEYTVTDKGAKFKKTHVSAYYILCPNDGKRIEVGRDYDDMICYIKNRRERNKAEKEYSDYIDKMYGDE